MAPKWADSPWTLIPTPAFSKDDHPAHFIAREMAFAHNAMLRGLNAIYLQALHIPAKPQDAKDFLFLIAAWCDWILDHHRLEEEMMFPSFEGVEGVGEGALAENVQQHHEFSAGLKGLGEYAKSVKPEAYDGAKVCELVKAFADTLHRHLTDEIGTLLKMESVQHPSPHSQKLLDSYKASATEAEKQDKFVVPPMVFGLCDKTYEDGNDWPALPMGVEFIMKNVVGRRHSGSWRFLPSGLDRMPRKLAFLGDEEVQ